MSTSISHKAEVMQVDDSHVTLRVLPPDGDSCQGCRLAQACGAGSSNPMTISVSNGSMPVKAGDRVNVEIAESKQWLSLLLVLVAQILLMAVTVGVGMWCGWSEGTVSLLSVVCVAIWFVLLYAFREKVRITFSWRITAIDHLT